MSRYVDQQQFIDKTGVPISGGKVGWFITGTFTEKPTFADAALTIPNSNPISLDNAGILPEVYLEDDVAYRREVHRNDGVAGNPAILNGEFGGSLFSQVDDITGLSGTTGAIVPLADWDAGNSYGINDLVTGSDLNYYQSDVDPNLNHDPTTTSGNFWTQVKFLGVYNANKSDYVVNDIVIDVGLIYRALNAGSLGTPATTPTDWANMSGIGDQRVYVPASAITSRITNGAEIASIETTNNVVLATLNFDPDMVEYAQFSLQMPGNWDAGELDFHLLWSADSASTNSVVWDVQVMKVSSGGDLNTAFGTTSSQTQANAGDGLLNISSPAALTIAGAAADDLVFVQISRDATNGADTLTVDARLQGIKMVYITTSSIDINA